MTKILIVEDHALVREAMAQRLARLEADLVCLESGEADEALALLEAHPDVDLAIVDLMLPGVNGFSLLAVLAKRHPDLPAIVVSAMDDDASVRRALAAGASGFVSKASSGEVLDGGMPTPRASISPASRSRQPAERYGLTVAQARVTELLVTGCSNREIATKLGLSEGTVKVHVTAIYRALGVSRRSQALVLLSRRNKGL
jgi:DNA-binding NarL/FixJ family response regulator